MQWIGRIVTYGDVIQRVISSASRTTGWHDCCRATSRTRAICMRTVIVVKIVAISVRQPLKAATMSVSVVCRNDVAAKFMTVFLSTDRCGSVFRWAKFRVLFGNFFFIWLGFNTQNDPTRRYETVHNDYGLMYGSGHPYQKWQQAKSWRRWLFWRCDYCMCICDEEGPGSDRYFSLRPVTSNTDSNRYETVIFLFWPNRTHIFRFIFHQHHNRSSIPQNQPNFPFASTRWSSTAIRNGRRNNGSLDSR